MSFDPVPPRLQSDDSVLTRLVWTLGVLAAALFIAAMLCAYVGLTTAAFVLAGLITVIGAICLLAVTAVEV